MNTNHIHLRVQDISLSFGGILALNNVCFEARQGEILAIIGPNGAGKTSLLNCLNNFYHPDKGSIHFDGHDLTRLPPHRLPGLLPASLLVLASSPPAAAGEMATPPHIAFERESVYSIGRHPSWVITLTLSYGLAAIWYNCSWVAACEKSPCLTALTAE